MYLCMENSTGEAHGVFLLNSNAMGQFYIIAIILITIIIINEGNLYWQVVKYKFNSFCTCLIA